MSESTEGAIQALIHATNRAWREGRTQELAELLHPDMAFVGPQLQVLAEGGGACVQRYDAFVSRADIHAFEEHPTTVRVTGSTAIATYEGSIKVHIDGS